MTTYDSTTGSAGSFLSKDSNRTFIWSQNVNLQTEATALTSAGYFASSDIIQLVDIPAYTWIKAAGLIVTTAEGDTLTLSLGDGDQAAGFVSAANGNTTANAHAQVAQAYGANTAIGRVYTSADTLDLTIASLGSQLSHACVVTVWAECSRIR